MLDKIKTFITKLNERGIPLPTLRDPVTKLPSVSLTMLWVSFNVVLIGLIGKWSKYLDVDVQQAIYWFMVCAGLYFSRSISKNGNKVDLNKEGQ
jgi:hypothetical protein